MYIYKGSTINLTCVVKHSPEPPPAIYWTHNSQVSFRKDRAFENLETEGKVSHFIYVINQGSSASKVSGLGPDDQVSILWTEKDVFHPH